METPRTSPASDLINGVITRAANEVRAKLIPVYTFALYHDHESAAVSVCVDTDTNSLRLVQSSNAFKLEHFAKAISAGDLHKAELFKANVGRNLSLGDFALVNVCRTPLGPIEPDDDFYLAIVRSLWDFRHQVAELSPDPHRLLFCSSGPKWEVQYTWSFNPIAK